MSAPLVPRDEDWTDLFARLFQRLGGARVWQVDVTGPGAVAYRHHGGEDDGDGRSEGAVLRRLHRAFAAEDQGDTPSLAWHDLAPPLPGGDRVLHLSLVPSPGIAIRASALVAPASDVAISSGAEQDLAQFLSDLAAGLIALDARAAEVDLMRQLIARTSLSGLIVDREGRLALDLSRDRTSLSRALGSDLDDPDAVRRLIKAAASHAAPAAPDVPPRSAWPECLYLTEGPGVAFLVPLVPAGGAPGRAPSHYAILEPLPRSEPTLAGLQTIFALTPAEARIALELFKGLRIKQIAHRLHLSQHTVRTYLKRCFHKMHVSTQAQLIARLERIAPPTRPGRPHQQRITDPQ